MSKIIWRYFEARDKEAVAVLHSQLEKKWGVPLDCPTDFLERPVVAAIVGETDGVITHGLFLEAEVEVQAMGANILPAAELKGATDLLMPVLLHYKIRIARAFVPTFLVEGKRGRMGPVGRILRKMGFTRETNAIQFFKWLIPEGGH